MYPLAGPPPSPRADEQPENIMPSSCCMRRFNNQTFQNTEQYKWFNTGAQCWEFTAVSAEQTFNDPHTSCVLTWSDLTREISSTRRRACRFIRIELKSIRRTDMFRDACDTAVYTCTQPSSIKCNQSPQNEFALRDQHTPQADLTALHGMQTLYSDENSVCLSVRPSNAWIAIDKTGEKSAQPYERSFSLVFREKEWLVGATPSEILGQPDPVGAKSPLLNR